MIGMKEVRIRINEDIWSKVKSQAALAQKHVKDYAAEILEKKVCERDGNGEGYKQKD